jgi:excinuclease ABC subunit A
MQTHIRVRGAKEHNLKNISIDLPREKLIIITGVSGSGKSSLAFDTIYAEGERRYLESLSTYARQFLGELKKPDVESIEGLSPAISIQQQTVHGNPRSIVGTVTEIYDYFRLLWGTIGTPTCPVDGRILESTTVDEIVDSVMKLEPGTKVILLAPKVRDRKGTHIELFEEIRKEGFARVRLNGEFRELDEVPSLDKNKKHTIEIVVDRLVIEPKNRARISDSVETALHYGDGVLHLHLVETKEEKVFSEKYFCPEHDISFDDIAPRMFSFNAPHGACPECSGLGEKLEFDPDLLADPEKSISEGALYSHPPSQNYWMSYLEALAKKHQFSLDTPWKKLPQKIRDIVMFGDSEKVKIHYSSERMDFQTSHAYEGVIPNLKRRYFETQSQDMREWFERWMRGVACESCHGERLKPESLAVKVGGKSIMDVTRMNVKTSSAFFRELAGNLNESKRIIAERILREIQKRLQFILDVGLDYLTLDRKVATISGGEFQRIRLATQIGSGLQGVLYVLDEPTIGLHSRDTERLIRTLKQLRDTGNTVIVVEHDEEVIAASDHIVDIGPGAGIYGGKLIAQGNLEEIKAHETSLTGMYMSGRLVVEIPEERREGSGKLLTVKGAKEHNLKNIDVSFPLGKFIAVTGVSGSGKSTLVNDILYAAVAKEINGSRQEPGAHEAVEGIGHLDKVIDIDQSPIGRTPRSNPATYTGVFGEIRDLYASLPEAKAHGYKSGRFSFNVKGGRCENCEGDGSIVVEMHFLPDVYLTCDVCGGKRYNRETLRVEYKGKSIAEVLDMTVDEAVAFFENIPTLKRKLQVLSEVGLGYIHLGQSATTLSGGEAQRIKLAKELSKIGTGNTLYILDEPTVGLHFDDVKKLVAVLQALVDKGNTVVVIEHNLDVVKVADHLIDLGPEGGEGGGRVLFEGTPEEIIRQDEGYTAKYLREYLERIGQTCPAGKVKVTAKGKGKKKG